MRPPYPRCCSPLPATLGEAAEQQLPIPCSLGKAPARPPASCSITMDHLNPLGIAWPQLVLVVQL